MALMGMYYTPTGVQMSQLNTSGSVLRASLNKANKQIIKLIDYCTYVISAK